MKKLPSLFRILPRLGMGNAVRVIMHRLAVGSGYFKLHRFADRDPGGEFFQYPPAASQALAPAAAMKLFGWYEQSAAEPPDWHSDPFSEGNRLPAERHWSDLLKSLKGDIDLKRYWEWSRFHWAPQFASEAACGGGDSAERLELWLRDWAAENQPYKGVNWTCGQEAGLRVLHLAQAAMLLDQALPLSKSLTWLLEMHLKRISLTIGYGIAQSNNHGATEAAAMMVAGSWLFQKTGKSHHRKAFEKGRRLLQRQILTLFQPDGTSNQYSTNYHRSVLEVCCIVQLWAQRLDLLSFDEPVSRRLAAATEHLRQLLDEQSGRVPNLGANDGSRVLGLGDEEVPDFRPVVELASALFLRKCAFREIGSSRLAAYRIEPPRKVAQPQGSRTYPNGGIHLLRAGKAAACMRFPSFRYRPSQADALHVDLWVGGENLLRDAGSYVYAQPREESGYYSGTGAHNTVQFDDRDQMPRLGRFLFGAWLMPRNVQAVSESSEEPEAAAGYRDRLGAEHYRAIRLSVGRLHCIDRISGRASKAVLRWRLAPGDWRLSGSSLSNGKVRICVEGDDNVKLSLSKGWESYLYLQKLPLPVLEVELTVPAEVRTVVEFA